MFDDIERLPPQNIEAEQAVLGAMLLERDAISHAEELLRDDDFYLESHRTIYRAIVTLSHMGQTVDIITLGTYLRDSGALEQVGGTLYLTTMMSATPTAAAIGHYAGMVRDRAARRAIITVAGEVMEEAYKANTATGELLSAVEDRVLAIRDRGEAFRFSDHQLGKLMGNAFERMEQEHETGEPFGLSSNLAGLNTYTAPGHQRGDLVIVAASTSVGKTTFAAHNYLIPAAQEGKHVLLFSLEMSQRAMAERAIAAYSDSLQNWHLKNFHWRKNHWESQIAPEIAPLIEQAWGWDCPVLLTPGLTPNRMKAIAKRKRKESGLDLVVIDGLWLMESDDREESERIKFTRIVNKVKQAAIELDVPIILLHQLRRIEGRAPILNDLKESGEIENTSDTVMLLYRPSRDGKTEESTQDGADYAEVHIAKQRNGRCGVVPLYFHGERFRFYDCETRRT